MLQQMTQVEIVCRICGQSEHFDVSDVDDLVYLEDILIELGWFVTNVGYVCPECWGN